MRIRSESKWERKLPAPLYWILFITFLIVICSIGIASSLVTNELYTATDNVLEMYDWQDNLHNRDYEERENNAESNKPQTEMDKN